MERDPDGCKAHRVALVRRSANVRASQRWAWFNAVYSWPAATPDPGVPEVAASQDYADLFTSKPVHGQSFPDHVGIIRRSA